LPDVDLFSEFFHFHEICNKLMIKDLITLKYVATLSCEILVLKNLSN